jgi:4-hydroxythreonine-4-phosphate dehydrogenase
MNKKTLVITPGDPEGVGPEVTAKALNELARRLKSIDVVIFGSSKPFRAYANLMKTSKVTFFEPPERAAAGYQSGWAIETATQFVMAAPRDRMMVTGPISKERLQDGGYFFKGHTDFLADLTQTKHVTMMLANDTFRVALVTNHCSLKEVSSFVTLPKLATTFEHAYAHAKDNLKSKKPKIAVLGLNPHSGENGILGSEEQKIILPAMKAFQKKNKDVIMTGPHPADSFFAIEKGKKPKDRHDVIVAMYHDQGLIPVKLSDFSNSMNMTLGLPIIRTSVDHGTAFDIAGKNKADASSMVYAIQKAIDYSKTQQEK